MSENQVTTQKATQAKPKVGILHAFFKSDCKGGGEKLIFAIRDHYKADLYAGAIDLENWNPELRKNDSFVQALWDPKYKFTYLHQESSLPIWGKIKRQLGFLLSPKIKELDKNDVVILSGNIALAQGRIKHAKKILYCHTTPRPFTDQLPALLESKPKYIAPFINFFAKLVVNQYRRDCDKMDLVISNSTNIQNRLKKYIGVDSMVIYPACDTNRFQWLGQEDYFISYARLEEIKRLKLIIDTFADLPNERLVICSAGPLKTWIEAQIFERNLKNITFEGLVSDERLAELVGKAKAGIYIPINEDAGITQIEIMAAGKPVIGVNEGALPDTVLDGQTGVIIPANPTKEDLTKAIQELTSVKALSMREACVTQAKKYDQSVFFQKLDKEIELLVKQN
jgi:glycosyltransferase involved in cell wall biosynthesis